MAKANEKVRKALRLNDVRQWQLAKMLGVAESTLIRRLRDELPKEEQKKLIRMIEEIANSK